MPTVESLIVRIEAQTEQLRRELSRAEKASEDSTRRIDRSLKRVDDSFGRLGKGVSQVNKALGLFGVALGAGALVGFGRSALKTADQLQTVSDKLGINVTQLQELRFAAQQAAGVTSGTLDLALQRFTRRLGEAVQGGGELKDTLRQYGIAVKNADGSARQATEVLRDLADAMKGAGSGGEQLRIAFKAFDSEGAALVSLLRQGSAGLDGFAARARAAGVVMDAQLVARAEVLNKRFEVLAETLTSKLQVAFLSTATAVDSFFSSFERQSRVTALVEGPAAALAALRARMAELRAELADLEDNWIKQTGLIDVLKTTLAALEAEERRLLAAIKDTTQAAKGAGDAASVQSAAVTKVIDKLKAEEKALGQTGLALEITRNLTEAQVAAGGAHADVITDLTTKIYRFNQAETARQAMLDESLKDMLAFAEAIAAAEAEQRELNERSNSYIVSLIQARADQDRLTEALRRGDGAYRLAAKALEIYNRDQSIGREKAEEMAAALIASEDAFERVRAASDALAGFMDRVFDRIGEAITQAFATGSLEAVKFGDIAKAVASEVAQEFLKLAVINPLKNQFLGGSGGKLLPTLSGVFDRFANGGGSSASSVAGGMPNPLSFFGSSDPIGSIFGGLDQALGLPVASAVPLNAAAGFVPELAGGASLPASGFAAAAPASLAFAPFLGMGAAAILMALANRGDGPAFGARYGINDQGLLDQVALGTDDGFSDANAQALADQTRELANTFLAAGGLTLKGAAFRGELAYNEGLYKASAALPANGTQSTQADVSGILGIHEDSRMFSSAAAAQADFIARNAFVALREGNLGGVTEANRAVYQVGLGNIVRGARDRNAGPDGLANLATDLQFLNTFAGLAEAARELGGALDEAAQRAAAATKSQDSYNQALEAVRATAREAGAGPLANIGDFLDNARRLFDPTGGDGVQIRLRLAEGETTSTARPKGGLDVTDAGVVNRFFDTDNGVDPSAAAAGFQASRLGLAAGFEEFRPSLMDDADAARLGLPGGFSAFGVTFRNAGEQGGPFGENGQPNVFTGGNGGLAFNQPGTGGNYDLTVKTAELVKALTGAEGLDYGAAIQDPLFAEGARLILESAALAINQVDAAFASITEQAQGIGGLPFIEELTAEVSPLVAAFVTMQEQIEAARGPLGELNQDLAQLGIETLDVDARIAAAQGDLRKSVEDSFLASLGVSVDRDTGEVAAGSGIRDQLAAAAQIDKNLTADFATIFGAGEGAAAAAAQAAIDAKLTDALKAMLAESSNIDVALAEIAQVFGDRVDGMDLPALAAGLDVAGDAVEQFAGEAARAANSLAAEAKALEGVINGLEGLKRSLASARLDLALDQALSPLSAKDRLAVAETALDAVVAKTGAGTAEERAAAQGELVKTTRDYLEAARDFYGSSEDYYQAYEKTQAILADQEAAVDQALQVARDQLDVLEQLLEKITPANDNAQSLAPVSYAAAGGGQYVATSSGVVSAGFDLGYDAAKNLQILMLLAAAGKALPSGFGEGQLGQLRASDASVDGLLKSQGFAEGGVITRAISFPLAGGALGQAGEAGPEAIMPLSRRGGRLGVAGPDMAATNNRLESLVAVTQTGFTALLDITERQAGDIDALRRKMARLAA